MNKQGFLFKTPYQHRLCAGGILRKQRAGRKQRPLSGKETVHIVFSLHRERLRCGGLRSPKNFQLTQRIFKKYSYKFFVKIEQISIQGNHIHALIRTKRRSQFHAFFRVVTGQIAQRFEQEGMLAPAVVTDTPHPGISRVGRGSQARRGTGLWRHRPFSRVIRGWRAYKVVRNYIQLNEKEALGEIAYRSSRLRGLSSGEWQVLWS